LIVADCSAIAALFIGEAAPHLWHRLRAAEGEICAPHLLDVEVLQVLRRLVRRGQLSTAEALEARQALHDLRIRRFPHLPLLPRIWELRDNFTAYDATYIALAEALDAPLLTCDAAVGPSPLHRAAVERF